LKGLFQIWNFYIYAGHTRKALMRMLSACAVPVGGFFHNPKLYDEISKNVSKDGIPYLFLYQPYPTGPCRLCVI
jgi:hypothetical protein